MDARRSSVAFVFLIIIRSIGLSEALLKSSFTDEFALLAFKTHIISDPTATITSNWSVATPICNWVGVECSTRHPRVAALDLSNMQLKGTIPPQLGNLSFLVHINLSHNSFYGELPDELFHLRRLKYINFAANRLTGTIPPSLYNMTSLEVLSLSQNLLQGTIPEQIGNLSNLNKLAMGSNLLHGSIPRVIFNMTSLQLISVPLNNLSGIVESICTNQSKLQHLDLSQNQLSGEFPSGLYQCKELQVMALDTNLFTGNIPIEIGNFTKLRWLYMGTNLFKGEIPREIFNLRTLELLSLEFNTLRGSLPREIGLCTSLATLYMDRTNLTGSIPVEIGNCSFLQNIFLGNNSLTGIIPQEIRNLQNLQVLRLGLNHISGTIPPFIFNISGISMIELTRNNLSGQFPSSRGFNLPNLQWVYLSSNKISGSIPESICNSSQIVDLILSANSLSGFIPDCLGNLTNLQNLDIEDNFLTTKPSSSGLPFLSSLTSCKSLLSLELSLNPLGGFLPNSIGNMSDSLQYFAAHNCKMKGIIPEEIRNLRKLINLNLGGNELVGTIPPTLGQLSDLQLLSLAKNKLQESIPHDLCSLQKLAYLYLDGNALSGSIPECLGNLMSIRSLILASNRFTGRIPSTLWTIQYVLQLDLSSNYLSGSLPLEIKNLKVVIAVDVSKNQLSGEIPNSIGDLQDLVNLSLSGNRFQGHIPPSIGQSVSLELLDLSSNSLSGEIPKSLEKLTQLKYFNVSFNQLRGEIPEGGQFRKFSIQSFLGNNALCGSGRLQLQPCKHSPSSRTPGIIMKRYILPTTASFLLMLALVFLFFRFRKGNQKPKIEEDTQTLATWRRISYRELEIATDGFHGSSLLGTGGFGSVYRGTLSDGISIAVKVFNLQKERAFRSFETECEFLRNLRHRNLVRVISSCSTPDFKALVVELMPNWNLETWLYAPNYHLDMLQRLNILTDVAQALEYLHYGCTKPVVHCDLKPSNVLLDQNMVAHVGDFGIAKLLGEGDSMTQTMTLATIGYMAPEYGTEGIVSVRCDIYSFGIIVIETFTRRKPTDEMFGGEMSLKEWVRQFLPKAITEVVDADLLRRDEEQFAAKTDCLISLLELALACCADLPEERMDIRDVVATLKKIKAKSPEKRGEKRRKG